jgi:hypothetical protein
MSDWGLWEQCKKKNNQDYAIQMMVGLSLMLIWMSGGMDHNVLG